MLRNSRLKLSVCISTFNRADFVRTTLESIIPQLTDECEVVVLDNGSTDETHSMLSALSSKTNRLRYSRQETNRGLDFGYDRTVELSRGEYCWLMPDDDLLMPGAVAAVLEVLHQDPSMVVVNKEIRDLTMERLIIPARVSFESDRVYAAGETDRLLRELGAYFIYIGCIIIQRSIWLSRRREQYYGSLLIHCGVLFEAPFPGNVVFVAKPLISYRFGNYHAFSIYQEMKSYLFSWPKVVSSTAVSDSTKRLLGAEPWRSLKLMLHYRARGYSLSDYRELIRPQLQSSREKIIPIVAAILPGRLLNLLLRIYYDATRQPLVLAAVKQSPFFSARGVSK